MDSILFVTGKDWGFSNKEGHELTSMDNLEEGADDGIKGKDKTRGKESREGVFASSGKELGSH